MKRRLSMLICICLMVVLSVTGTAAKIKTVKIQPVKLASATYWVYDSSWKKTPTIPKNKWVKFTLPVTKNSKDYYFKFVPTKKKGYKYFLTTKRTKKKNDSKIRDCSIVVYQNGYDDVLAMDANTRSKWTERIPLQPGVKSWILIGKDPKLYDPEKANIKLLLREVPMNPTKVNITEVTNTPKSFTVKYDKATYATKYQVAYKKSGGKWKYVKTKSLSKTVSGLKTGKKYTVKVRAIRIVKSKKYYGKWSVTKTVDLKQTTTAVNQ